MMPLCMLEFEGHFIVVDDLKNDAEFGFKIIHCDEFQTQGIDKIA